MCIVRTKGESDCESWQQCLMRHLSLREHAFSYELGKVGSKRVVWV